MEPNEIRGRVNLMTYGLDFSRRVPDERVERYANQLVDEMSYRTPTAVFYEAILAALESGLTFAHEGEREAFVRDCLRRLRDALDARRPWPVRPYLLLQPHMWTQRQRFKVIARLSVPESNIDNRLRSWFYDVPKVGRVLILKLRDADTVVLHAGPATGEGGSRKPVGVALLADTDDPAATIVSFRQLCEFTDDEVVPVGRLRGLLAGRRHRLVRER